MNIKPWTIAAALLSAGMAQATCYSVYKADGTIIQQTSTTPVDLTHQIGDTVVARFGPGTTMVVSDSGFYCKDQGVPVVGAPRSLAEIVQAEEEKKMVLKAPAAKEDAVKVAVAKQEAPETEVAKEDSAKTVMVKEDGTRTVVETRQGTVLKVKGKGEEAQ